MEKTIPWCTSNAAVRGGELFVLIVVTLAVVLGVARPCQGQVSPSGLFGSQSVVVDAGLLLHHELDLFSKEQRKEIEAEIESEVTRELEKEGVEVSLDCREIGPGMPLVVVNVYVIPYPDTCKRDRLDDRVLAVQVRVTWEVDVSLTHFPQVRLNPGHRRAIIWYDDMMYTVPKRLFRRSVVKWAGVIAALIPEARPTGIYNIVGEPEVDSTSTGG